MSVDTEKLNESRGRFINDLGASVHAGMTVIGDRVPTEKSTTAAKLTKRTKTDERYNRERAASQGARWYLT